MYSVVLVLHSLVRWVVVIAGLAAIVQALGGWLVHRGWTRDDTRLQRIFSSSVEAQILIGVILYILSPLTQSVLRNFGGAMSNPGLRFFGVEHVIAMVVALALIHMGRVLARRQPDGAPRHRMAAIFYIIAMLVILAAIPWPFTGPGLGRPWIRL